MAILELLPSPSGQTVITPRMTDFDLAKMPARAAGCADRRESDEIIVCAPKGMDIWIADAGRFAAKPLRAALIGPMKADTMVHVVQHGSPMGTAPAAAVTLRWRF